MDAYTALVVVAASTVGWIVHDLVLARAAPAAPAAAVPAPAIPTPAGPATPPNRRRQRNNKNTSPTISPDVLLLDLERQLKDVRAENNKLRDRTEAQAVQIEALNGNLLWLISLIAPLYVSLLAKGIASYAFWHGTGLYPPNVRLSVGQLTFLNESIKRKADDKEYTPQQRLEKAKDVVRQYPSGPPPGTASYTTSSVTLRYPELQDVAGGNGLPSNDPSCNIEQDTMSRLVTLWIPTINDRDRAAHEASAATLGRFLKLIATNRTPGANDQTRNFGFCIPHFYYWRKVYRILFGVTIEDGEGNSNILTNSGSLEEDLSLLCEESV